MFLPERHRSPPPHAWGRTEPGYDVDHPNPMQWRPARQRPSFWPFLLTAIIATGLTFAVSAVVDHQRRDRVVYAPRQEPLERYPRTRPAAVAGPCADASAVVHGGPQPGGFPTRDLMGWLPKCDGGRR